MIKYLKIPCMNNSCRGLAILSIGDEWRRVHCPTCYSESVLSRSFKDTLEYWYQDRNFYIKKSTITNIIIIEEKPL
jgi:hypothetical protein